MNWIFVFVVIVVNFLSMDVMYKIAQEDALNGKSTNKIAIIKVNKTTQDSIKLIPKIFEEHYSSVSLRTHFDTCSHVFIPIDGFEVKK